MLHLPYHTQIVIPLNNHNVIMQYMQYNLLQVLDQIVK